MRDLRHADVGIGEQRLGGLVSFGGRSSVRPERVERRRDLLGCTPGSGCARIPPKRQAFQKTSRPSAVGGATAKSLRAIATVFSLTRNGYVLPPFTTPSTRRSRLGTNTPLVVVGDLPFRRPGDRELLLSGLRLAAGEEG